MKKKRILPHLANAAQLNEFHQRAVPKIAIRHQPDAAPFEGVTHHIMVCCGTGCTASA